VTVDEIIFVASEDADGGYTARALGESIFTEADDLHELDDQIGEAVKCHFEDGAAPRVIRLHFPNPFRDEP